MSDRVVSASARYLPHVIVATAVVAALPVAVVWALRASGLISSPWISVPVAVVLSLVFASAGSACWKRRRGSEDVMFSELLVWGWLRRLYVEHQLANATKLLDLDRPADQARITTASVERRGQLLRQLAVALEAQDHYTEGHSRRVARHATMIAHKMGLSGDQAARFRAAAAVHDVGKLHVPLAVLNKTGKLTTAEFELVKCHSEAGAEMVACLEDDELTAIVRHHHERMDGTGYPAGLADGQIPLGARIVAVADAFDAITAARPYRPAAPHKQAFDTLAEESGTHFDPVVVRAFIRCYEGRRALAYWVALAAFLQRAPARASGARTIRPASAREIVAGTLSVIAVAAVAIAAPIGVSSRYARRAVSPPPASAAVAPNTYPGTVPPRFAKPAAARPSSRPATGIVARGRIGAGLHPTSHGPATTPNLRPGTQHASAPTHSQPPTPPPTQPGGSPPSTPGTTPVKPPRPPNTTTTNPTRTGTTGGPATGAPSPPPATTPSTPTTTTVATTPSSPPITTTSTPTSSSTALPASKDQCKGGGWAQYGFQNQGQCVALVEHHN